MAATTVPTRADILVPETLLKKRKSQEKAREQRASELRKRREVLCPCKTFRRYDLTLFQANKEKRTVIFKRAEKYVKEVSVFKPHPRNPVNVLIVSRCRAREDSSETAC